MELAFAVALGFVVGILAGALGVGGGAVTVPVMVIVLGIDQASAQGTSLLAILPTSASGAWEHMRHGTLGLQTSAMLGTAGAVGALVGAGAALHLEPRRLRQLFALYLLLVGAQTLRGALRRNPRPA